MTQQYFQVGEEVILESIERPDLNGEYEIIEILDKGEIITNDAGRKWRCATDDSYFLSGLEDDDGQPVGWHPSALRKKHTPGEDFQSLINSLSKNKVAS